jgi:hypothetical protein
MANRPFCGAPGRPAPNRCSGIPVALCNPFRPSGQYSDALLGPGQICRISPVVGSPERLSRSAIRRAASSWHPYPCPVAETVSGIRPRGVALLRWSDDDDWSFSALCVRVGVFRADAPDDDSSRVRQGLLPGELPAVDAYRQVEQSLADEFGDLDFSWREDAHGKWFAEIGPVGGSGPANVREPR